MKKAPESRRLHVANELHADQPNCCGDVTNNIRPNLIAEVDKSSGP
jgi:hypothetical protein